MSEEIIRELNEMWKIVLRPDNPIFISLALTGFFVLQIYLLVKRMIIPMKKEEQKKRETERARLIELFAELDFDPVIRINSAGVIMHANKAALEILKGREIIGEKVTILVPEFKNAEVAIVENAIHFYNVTINEKDYSVVFRGVAEFEFGQLYLHDITERKSHEKKLKELSGRIQMLVEEERRKIAI